MKIRTNYVSNSSSSSWIVLSFFDKEVKVDLDSIILENNNTSKNTNEDTTRLPVKTEPNSQKTTKVEISLGEILNKRNGKTQNIIYNDAAINSKKEDTITSEDKFNRFSRLELDDKLKDINHSLDSFLKKLKQ